MTRPKSDVPDDAVIDFDSLSALARNNPEEFERSREKIIQAFIDSSGGLKREMLLRFQWRIDQTRRQAKNPLHALIKLNQMMWSSVDDLVNAEMELSSPVSSQTSSAKKAGELIDLDAFRKKKNTL